MAGFFNKKDGGQSGATYATKADVLLQRQAEIAGKLDMLLAANNSRTQSDALADKVAQETAFLGKQASAIYDKLAAENQKLRMEIKYVAAQCENIFVKLSSMISSLEEKMKENAVDYEKIAEASRQDNWVEEEPSFDDEVAPAAYSDDDEQLTISENGYIDYDELAARLCDKLAEKGIGSAIDYDELAKKVADCIPPQEVISPDYVASKVAEQIVIPQVVVSGDGEAKPLEVHATAEVDYEELAARVAEKIAPAEQNVVAAAAESTEVADSDALSDEIARKVSALSPNDFDIIVDDEGCRSLAEAVVDSLDYDRIIEKIAERSAAGEVAVTDAAMESEDTESMSSEEIAQLVSEKLAANGVNEETIADRTAAAISNYLPEVDADDIADKVAAAVLASIPATEVDYDAIINGVCDRLGQTQVVAGSAEEAVPAAAEESAEPEEENDYDIVIDEEGLQKITDSISWKVTASTNAMLEGMDDKLAAMRKELEDMRAALDEEKKAVAEVVSAEAVEEAAEETAEEAAEETVDQAAESEEPAAVAATAEEIGEINRKIDELTARIEELLTPDEEELEEVEDEAAEAEEGVESEDGVKAELGEIKAAIEEIKNDGAVEELKAKVDELTARIEELLTPDDELLEEGEEVEGETAEAEEGAEAEDEVKAELEAIRTALDEIRHDPAIQELKGEVAELTSRIDELFAPEEVTEEGEAAEEEDPVQAEFDSIKQSLEDIKNDPAIQDLKGEVAELTARIDELVARGVSEEQASDEDELAEVKQEIEEIKRTLDQIKALIVAGAVVTTVAAAGSDEEVNETAETVEDTSEEAEEEAASEEPVEEPAEEAVAAETEEPAEAAEAEEPAPEESAEAEESAVENAEISEEVPAEDEEEEQLVTVSDIVDESEVADEPVDEAMENIFDDVDEQTVQGEADPDGIPGISNGGVDFANMMKYNRSFIARIIQSSDDVKRYYGQIKNAMLAYKKVNSSIAWGAERFNKGRETIAKLKIRGKTLCLYLNLDPNEYKTSVYHHVDVSDNKSMHGTPMMVKIKSPLGVKKAIRLIDEMLAKRNGEKRPIQERDYAAMYPYETMEELIEDGLVKDVSKNK
mgnify:FL=1